MRRSLVVLALSLLVAGCGSSSQTKPAENGPIAFTSGSSLEHGIVRRDPNGERRRITNGLRDLYPTWSPDGELIAFVRPFGQLGLSHLFVVGADGSGLHEVGSVATDSTGLSWSADSSRILFGDGRGISAIEPDGTGLEQLTPKGSSPAWAGDGTIAFTRIPELFAMDADGGNAHRLVELGNTSGHLYSLAAPAWSPDGEHVVFVRTDIMRLLKPDGVKIEVADADGANERTVTAVPFGQAEVLRPSWSPDGREIVFAGKHGERYGIWTVPSSGGEPRLVAEGVTYAMPSWGPAGA
jgi:Tol biopolymer transport system component